MGKVAERLSPMKAAPISLAGLLLCAPAFAQQSVIDSIDMQAVCAQAQGKLDYFGARLALPAANETAFRVQVAVPVSQGGEAREYVWLTGIKPFDAYGEGIVEADAERFPLKKGETLKFRRDMICDWGFERDGRMIGHYTTRAALTVLAPDVAMVVGARLGTNPE